MSNSRFTRLNDYSDAHNIVSPPPQYFSPEPSQSPGIYNNSAFYPQNDGSDYMNRGVHTVSQFSYSSQHGSTVGGSYNPLSQNQDTEKLLSKKKRKSSSSVFSRRASSQFFQVVHSGVSRSAAPLFAAPWRHELTSKDNAGSLPSTVRRFSRRRQRRRILVNGLIKWLIPVTFCGCLAAVMWTYDQRPIITHREKYTFNALILGFSLCLGFAVASGLKSYAGLLRWRLLAGRYREIQDFELLMGCESQTKVLRLIWAGKTPGSWMPNGLQIMCCLYLILMVGLQVTIACLGLTQSVDTSDTLVGTVYGNVSVVYLEDIVTIDYGEFINNNTGYGIQGGAANSYGVAAQHFSVYEYEDTSNALVPGYSNTIYTDKARSHYWYYFIDRSADPKNSLTLVTERKITSTARCWQFPIVKNKYAQYTNSPITYTNTTSGRNFTFNPGDQASHLSSTYYANMAPTCGPRCTEMYIYNTGLNDTTNSALYASQLYYCQNTFSEVLNIPSDINATAVSLPDQSARLLAGAIGYSGTHYVNNTMQTRNYPVDSLWSWNGDAAVSTTWAADAIMHFGMGALAAMDQDGIRRVTTGRAPVTAQTVSVIWPWAIALLVVVPGIQLVALLGTVIWANGAVIKDDSFLSAARLLRPVVDKLGNRGCALTGDEIAEALGNYKIIYGVRLPGQHGYDRSGNDDGMMHLDVVAEEEGLGKGLEEGWRPGRSMPQGRYDGLAEDEDEKEEEEEEYDDGDDYIGNEKAGLLSGNERRIRGKRRMSL